jgi:hypothetical protein
VKSDFAIELSVVDEVSIEDFPLKWRWADEKWSKLPLEILQQIKPLTDAKALEVFELHISLYRSNQLDTELFEGVDEFDAEAGSTQDTGEWLKQKIGLTSTDLVLSWDRSTAVVTTSQVFCDHWHDFCYPASDDVSISTLGMDYLLSYHHNEVFCFGKIKKERILNDS